MLPTNYFKCVLSFADEIHVKPEEVDLLRCECGVECKGVDGLRIHQTMHCTLRPESLKALQEARRVALKAAKGKGKKVSKAAMAIAKSAPSLSDFTDWTCKKCSLVFTLREAVVRHLQTSSCGRDLSNADQSKFFSPSADIAAASATLALLTQTPSSLSESDPVFIIECEILF